MALYSESPLDDLWKEYSSVFREFDDLTLARWLAQTLGQLQGRTWRGSHPLVGAYRLAASVAHDRQIWHKRLATPPAAYSESTCCRAPLLPLLTRDVLETGLGCVHCGETCLPFDELPVSLRTPLTGWAEEYGEVHAVAHWDDAQRRRVGNYDAKFEDAATRAEGLLARIGRDLAPLCLEFYPALVWEDQDECLEVHPEDVEL